MKRWCAIIQHFSQMRIIQKLIVGYLLLICLPFAFFSYLFYTRMVDNVLDRYRSDQLHLAEQAYSRFQLELSKVESLYQLFQNNGKLVEYLAGAYSFDWEMVYNYLREIRPTFSFSYLNNPFIRQIRIYKHDERALVLEPDIVNLDAFDDPVNGERVLALPPDRGLWTYEAQERGRLPVIHYTRKLYNPNYTRELGILRITASEKLVQSLLQPLNRERSRSALLDAEGRVVYEDPGAGWSGNRLAVWAAGGPDRGVASFYTDDRRYLVTVLVLDRLGLTLVTVSEAGAAGLRLMPRWLLAGGILLLLLLSLIYYMAASSLTLRIIRFTRHLKRVPDLKMATFPGKSGNDEIGFLISSYNNMIGRLNEMEERVRRTELRKKEAEIKMLQAQIKPHFLYNTLETMRMMALMKNDLELADVAFTLANLIRYSVGKSGDETTLRQELDHVRDYIAIHKVRMRDRLTFELQVEADVSDFRCPRFILQPIVENGILHGLGNMRATGLMRITVRDAGDYLRIDIFNNGAVIPPDRLREIREMLEGKRKAGAPGGGIGLVNVQERIKSYFGEDSGITADSSAESGTVFTLRLRKREGGTAIAESVDRG